MGRLADCVQRSVQCRVGAQLLDREVQKRAHPLRGVPAFAVHHVHRQRGGLEVGP